MKDFRSVKSGGEVKFYFFRGKQDPRLLQKSRGSGIWDIQLTYLHGVARKLQLPKN